MMCALTTRVVKAREAPTLAVKGNGLLILPTTVMRQERR